MASLSVGVERKRAFQELVIRRVRAVFKPDGVEKRTAVQLEAGDIALCTGPKSGTTWMQHILHGLRTGGSMDFDDIDEVVPVLELAGLSGPRHTDEQAYAPRMFKTHSVYQDRPTGAKTIVVTRSPKDAALSYYYYYANWVFKTEEMGIDDFIDIFYCQSPSVDFAFKAHQMRHLASWYPHRNDKDVLWLHYEDLKADLKKCIGLISDFVGIGVGDEELLSLVERQASLEFMKLHDSKFNCRALKSKMNEAAELPNNAGLDTRLNPGKIRNGGVGESKEVFSETTNETMNKLWNKLLKPVTGFDSYEEMRASINKELGRSF